MDTLYVAQVDFLSADRYLAEIPVGFRLRAEKYRRKDDRARSLCCLWLLCAHLRGQGIHPEKLTFSVTDRGKPVLSLENLHFSFSHSRDLASVLLSQSPCGVDVEGVRPELDTDRLAEKLFSTEELAAYRASDDKKGFFTALFTKKEAEGKRRGTGVFPHQMAEIPVDDCRTERFFCGGSTYYLSVAPRKTDLQTILVGAVLKG